MRFKADFKPQKNRETLATDTALKIRNEFKRIIIEDYKKKRTSTEKLTARQRIRKEYSEKNREAAGGDIAAGEEVVDEREREKILIERERESDG